MSLYPVPVSLTLIDRGSKYGDFLRMSDCAQRLRTIIRAYAKTDMECYKYEALEMICLKMARLVCGDSNNRDSWHDIEGYARLAGDLLTPKEEA